MATVQIVKNKKGLSAKITICFGSDRQGKKITKSTTYPTKDMILPPDILSNEKKFRITAEKYASEYEEKLKAGYNVDNEKITFEEYAYKWLEAKKNELEYNSITGYTQMLESKILPYFKIHKIRKIKLQMIDEFLLTLANEYGTWGMKKFKTILSGIFKTAVKYGVIEINPCEGATIPKPKKKTAKTADLKFFTPEQSKIFLASLNMKYENEYKAHDRIDDTGKTYHVNDYTTEGHPIHIQYKVFYNIAIFCGMRRGEILALHWDDIDFSKRIINVTKSVSRSDNGLKYKEPKTKTSIRKVEFSEQILSLLLQYRTEYNIFQHELGDNWKGNGNLFIQIDGKLMDISTPTHHFGKHIRKYNEWVEKQNKNLPKEQRLEKLPEISLHGLRHTFATIQNYLDTDIVAISKILGHAQVSTTMNIYTHSFEAQKRIAAEKIDKYFNEGNHA